MNKQQIGASLDLNRNHFMTNPLPNKVYSMTMSINVVLNRSLGQKTSGPGMQTKPKSESEFLTSRLAQSKGVMLRCSKSFKHATISTEHTKNFAANLAL